MGQRCATVMLAGALLTVAGCAPTSDGGDSPAALSVPPATSTPLSAERGVLGDAGVAPEPVFAQVGGASVTAPPLVTETTPDHLEVDDAPPPPTPTVVVLALPEPPPTTTVAVATPSAEPAEEAPSAPVEEASMTTTTQAPAEDPTPTTTAPPPTTTAPPPTTTAPAPPPGSIAGAFLADINGLRGSVGVAGVARSSELDALARSWAETMAADDWLRHSTLIHEVIARGWVAAGENIAFGPTESAMFAGLRNSPSHYDNMVDPSYTQVGIGVTVVGGVVWTAHLFAG